MTSHPHRLVIGLSLTLEQRVWLDRKATSDDRSLAWLVRHCIVQAMEREQGAGEIVAPTHSNGQHADLEPHDLAGRALGICIGKPKLP